MRDHTSLIAWQVSHTLVLGVFGLAKEHWTPHISSIFAQLQRSALSTQLNIAEGYALCSTASFKRHLRIAYGSAVESTEALRLLADMNHVHPASIDPLIETSIRTQRLVLGLLKRQA